MVGKFTLVLFFASCALASPVDLNCQANDVKVGDGCFYLVGPTEQDETVCGTDHMVDGNHEGLLAITAAFSDHKQLWTRGRPEGGHFAFANGQPIYKPGGLFLRLRNQEKNCVEYNENEDSYERVRCGRQLYSLCKRA